MRHLRYWQFVEIPDDIPNRGIFRVDITLHGLTYLQRISDVNVLQNGKPTGIHIEPQTRERKTQNRPSAAVSFGRFSAERLRTPIWCRRAMCSNSSAAREWKIEHSVEKTADNRISIG